MKALILGIILAGCTSQSFQSQLFTTESEATIIDSGIQDSTPEIHDATSADIVVQNDSGLPDSIGIADSSRDRNKEVQCCRRTDFPECEQCPNLNTSDLSCTVEGTRCLFSGIGFVEWKVCQNSQWQNGEPFGC